MSFTKRLHSLKIDAHAHRVKFKAEQNTVAGTSLPTSSSSSSTGYCASVKKPDFGISSLSLGTLIHHSLPEKIRVAASHGYDGIEIFIPDFEDFIRQCGLGMHQDMVKDHLKQRAHTALAPSFEQGCAAAIASLCEKHSLKIHCLQPLRDFENVGECDVKLNFALSKAERYLHLMQSLNTDLLLVCSNNLAPLDPLALPGATYEKYRDAQVKALRALGDRAAKLNLRIGYEPLAWGTVVNTWNQVWDIVKRVDMDNVGVILDTFNSLANYYADPSNVSGIKDGMTVDSLYQYLSDLFDTIPPSKLFLLQVADAEKVNQERTFHTSRNAPAKMKWSRTSRLFPCEEHRGAYLPVEEYVRTIMDLGYTGPWSLEIFSSCLDQDMEGTASVLAQRGMEGLEKLYARIAYDA